MEEKHVYLYDYFLILSPVELKITDTFLVKENKEIDIISLDGNRTPIPNNCIYYKIPFSKYYIRYTEFNRVYDIIMLSTSMDTLVKLSDKNLEERRMSRTDLIFLTEQQLNDHSVVKFYIGQQNVTKEKILSMPIGNYRLRKLYKLAYHNLEIPLDIIDNKLKYPLHLSNVNTWYENIFFVKINGKEVPVTPNGLLTSKIDNFLGYECYISPEFPNVIITSHNAKSKDEVKVFNYTITSRSNIRSEISTEVCNFPIDLREQTIAGQGTIVRDNIENSYNNIIFSGNDYNLNGIDLQYLLGSAIVIGRNSIRKYLSNQGGKDLRELYWVEDSNTLDL